MKLLYRYEDDLVMRAFTLSLALLASVAQAGHLHVRIHTKLAAEWEQCMWEDKAERCEAGLACIETSEDVGYCMTTSPGEGEQCAGQSIDGPWSVSCNDPSLTCTFYSSAYSHCARSESEKPEDQQGSVDEFGQCKWPDGSAACKSGLQCIEESPGYGHCAKKAAELWGQCGGKTVHGAWSATCPSDASCQYWDDWYSQCVPSDSTQAPTPTPTPTKSSGGGGDVKVWGQCGGDSNYSGGVTCESGASCVRHSNWYAQCKPYELPVGELCAQNDGGANVWSYEHCADGATCVSASATESRCKK